MKMRSSYRNCRVVIGQLWSLVDIWGRILEEELEAELLRV